MSAVSAMLVALMVGLMFVLQGCGKTPAPAPAPASQSIATIAGDNKDLSTLVAALKAGGLVDTLSGKGPFTVFAPTDEAFKALDEGLVAALLLPANKDKLVEVLKYHVANGKVLSSELKNGEQIETLEKQNITVDIKDKTVKINNATVTKADVVAVNGVIHLIDAVLIPPGFVPPTYKNIPQTATADTDLSTLVEALTKGGLVDTLAGTGPFTVFAPTNEAFKAVNATLLAKLLSPANKAKLVEVLEYHVTNGKVLSTDLKNGQNIVTLDDKKTVEVTITDKTVKIGAATVQKADVMAVNGVVHIIDAVLIPPGFVPPTEGTAAETPSVVI